MQEHFVNYNQALALKELGFKERCSHYFEHNKFKIHNEISGWDFNTSFITCVSAPLKSQVFKWFRDKHMIGHNIECPFVSYSGKNARLREDNRYMMYITDEDQLSLTDDEFYHGTYEEAESACIDKLIEIIKIK
jgi:hypothetical protein